MNFWLNVSQTVDCVRNSGWEFRRLSRSVSSQQFLNLHLSLSLSLSPFYVWLSLNFQFI